MLAQGGFFRDCHRPLSWLELAALGRWKNPIARDSPGARNPIFPGRSRGRFFFSACRGTHNCDKL